MSTLVAIGPEVRTLRERVLQAVRAAVVSGELSPGSRIGEVDLSRSLGVSRGTLREAVRRLEQEGLLVTLPHRGTFVRELSAEEIPQVYGVRLALEGHAARCAAAQLTPAMRGLLEQRLRELEAATASHRFADAVSADLRFHEAVCTVSGNRFLIDQWRSLVGLIAAVMHTAGAELVAPLQSPAEHRALLDHVVAGDPERIDAIWREHFDAGARTLAAAVARRVPVSVDAAAGAA